MNPRCPTCQSLDVDRGEPLTCRACGTTWRLENGAPVAVSRPAGARSTTRVPTLIAAAVAGALVVGGYWMLAPEGTTPVTPPPPPVTAEPAAPKPDGAPTAAIEDLREGKTAIGGRFWIMTYRNTGTVPIERPGVVVRLTDAGGKVLHEEAGDGPRELLQPGEAMPAFVLMGELPKGVPADARAQVEVTPPVAAARDAWKIALTVEGIVTKEQPLGGTLVIGRVINPHRGAARFVEVRVVGVDAEGHPVSWGQGLPTVADLEPGAEAPFQVRAGSFETEKPARYEAYALANVR